jgi:hypothetical protein
MNKHLALVALDESVQDRMNILFANLHMGIGIGDKDASGHFEKGIKSLGDAHRAATEVIGKIFPD